MREHEELTKRNIIPHSIQLVVFTIVACLTQELRALAEVKLRGKLNYIAVLL
jgi:hypothetical protein